MWVLSRVMPTNRELQPTDRGAGVVARRSVADLPHREPHGPLTRREKAMSEKKRLTTNAGAPVPDN